MLWTKNPVLAEMVHTGQFVGHVYSIYSNCCTTKKVPDTWLRAKRLCHPHFAWEFNNTFIIFAVDFGYIFAIPFDAPGSQRGRAA